MNLPPQVNDRVLVTEEGLEAIVIRVFTDGDLEVRFDDGDEGSYSLDEVELMTKK